MNKRPILYAHLFLRRQLNTQLTAFIVSKKHVVINICRARGCPRGIYTTISKPPEAPQHHGEATERAPESSHRYYSV